MNAKKLLLIALTSAALSAAGLVHAADTDASTPNNTEGTQNPAKKKVKPHSHPRDAKGMGVAEKSANNASAAASERDEDKESKIKPHSHPREAK